MSFAISIFRLARYEVEWIRRQKIALYENKWRFSTFVFVEFRPVKAFKVRLFQIEFQVKWRNSSRKASLKNRPQSTRIKSHDPANSISSHVLLISHHTFPLFLFSNRRRAAKWTSFEKAASFRGRCIDWKKN